MPVPAKHHVGHHANHQYWQQTHCVRMNKPLSLSPLLSYSLVVLLCCVRGTQGEANLTRMVGREGGSPSFFYPHLKSEHKVTALQHQMAL